MSAHHRLTIEEREALLKHYVLLVCPGCGGSGDGLDGNCRACNGRGELVDGAPDYIPAKLPAEIGPACPGCHLADLWPDCDCPVRSAA